MTGANDALQVLTPLLYLSAVFAYWLQTGEARRPPARLPITLAAATLFAHGGLLLTRAMILGQAPWTTYYDMLSALAFVMTLTYVLVEVMTRVPATGFDLLPVPFIATTYSAAMGPHAPKPDPTLDSPFFLMHTLPAIGGIAAIVVSGIYGLLYLRLERAIRAKKFGGLFARLPDLEVLARMNTVAAAVGFLLVTAAIGWGATWYGEVFERVRVTEPKIFITLLIWTVLLVPLVGKVLRRWPDRATAIVSVIALGLVAVSIILPMLPFVGFHGHT